jgi:hypothetical protein
MPPLLSPRNKNRRQPLATDGDERRRWESNPRWRICNPYGGCLSYRHPNDTRNYSGENTYRHPSDYQPTPDR